MPFWWARWPSSALCRATSSIRIIGHGTHRHPLAVMVAILGGAELAGVVGIFLAIPVAGILSVCYRHCLSPGVEKVRRTRADLCRRYPTSGGRGLCERLVRAP